MPVTRSALASRPARDASSGYAGTDPEEVYAGKYPLARFLYVYVNRPPGKALDALTEQFLLYTLSREGQQIVLKDGYLPLQAKVVAQELAKRNPRALRPDVPAKGGEKWFPFEVADGPFEPGHEKVAAAP